MNALEADLSVLTRGQAAGAPAQAGAASGVPMPWRRWKTCMLVPGVIIAAVAGCATVDPRADYSRVAGHIAAATGREFAYRPDSDGRKVEERIEHLLRAGLTADAAAEVALLNNRGIQAALFDVGAARADVVQAGLLANPTLSFGLRFPDAGGLANFEAALVQNLADLWQIPVRQRAAERVLDRTILQIAGEISVAVFDTRRAYYRARQADRKRDIATESVQIAQQVLDLALARQQAGAGGEVDVNLARAEVQDAELALRNTTLESFESRSALCTLLSLKVAPDTLELTDELPEPPAWTVADQVLLDLAAEHRLDLRAAVQATEAAAARIRQEQLKLFPTLDVGLALERDERRAPGESGGQDAILGPTIGMELPIFNQNQGGIARARFEYEQSRKLLDNLAVEVHQEARVASARARTAWGTASYYRDQVMPLRETSLELARTAYQAGRTSLLNVLETQRALLTARAGYADSLQASAAALVELEKATGQPLARILEAAEEADHNEANEDRKDDAQ
ncbi:MAG: TolC family protein [Planctomycetota bacterium]